MECFNVKFVDNFNIIFEKKIVKNVFSICGGFFFATLHNAYACKCDVFSFTLFNEESFEWLMHTGGILVSDREKALFLID